jgi:hypothetical protein
MREGRCIIGIVGRRDDPSRLDPGALGPIVGTPAGSSSEDWSQSVEISGYILAVEKDGLPYISLQTADLKGAGVAGLRFREAIEGSSASLTSPGVWPGDAYLEWFLPPAAFDAILAILRDGEPPSLFVHRSQGELKCSLTGQIKTRPVT